MLSPHKIDLRAIEGDGDFLCPKCSIMISPDDESETVYTVLDTIVGENDCLDGVIIRCNRCHCTISLEGFSALEEESSRVKISEAKADSETGYRTRHTISFTGHHLGHVVVEYAQKEDVKAFKRIRSLRAGDAFKSMITIENVESLTKNDLHEVAQAVKRRFKSLRGQDIYLMKIQEGHRTIIGRASSFIESPIIS